MDKEEIENIKDEISGYAGIIETVNPENISEEDLADVDLPEEIIEGIKENEIPLYYSQPGGFHPYVEKYKKGDSFGSFLIDYAIEMKEWSSNELDVFEDIEDAETVFKTLKELQYYEDDEVASWRDDEMDTISWNEVHIVKFRDGSKFLQHVGGWRGGIMALNEDDDVDEIIKRLKNGKNVKEDILEGGF